MKISKRKLLGTLALLSLTLCAVYAQAQRTQTLSYVIVPSETVTTVPVDLGSIQGGSSGTQTFNSVISVMTTTAGTHTVSMALSINSTLFSAFVITIYNGSGNYCTLSLTTLTCTYTFSGAATNVYNENVQYTAIDGIAANGTASILAQVS